MEGPHMSILNLDTQTIKALVHLTKAKENLLREVKRVDAQLERLLAGRKRRVPGVVMTASRSPRILTAEKMLEILKAAGADGMSVSGIADELGVDKGRVYAWFSQTGKKNPQIQKIARATYRIAKRK